MSAKEIVMRNCWVSCSRHDSRQDMERAMTKTVETPEETAARLANSVTGRHMDPLKLVRLAENIADAIRSAQAEDRERCAQIADEEANNARQSAADDREQLGDMYDPDAYGIGYDAGSFATASTIARDIRSLPTSGGEG